MLTLLLRLTCSCDEVQTIYGLSFSREPGDPRCNRLPLRQESFKDFQSEFSIQLLYLKKLTEKPGQKTNTSACP